jgi:Tfp pilus assembly protein PilF
MHRSLHSCIAPLALLLSACASPPPMPAPPDALFHDAAFAPVAEATGPEQVMAVSEPMRHYLRHELAPLLKRLGPVQGLATAMTQPHWLQLRYDASRTRTAAQAFESRSGNCLSLVILSAALARELGLQAYFQEVLTDELWSRQAGLYVASGHVNLTLGRPRLGETRGYDANRAITIDFLPPAEAQALRTRPLNERSLLAMFMNNRAAEALAEPDLDKAYAWARAAVQQDPGLLSAYNTLAVVYLRHGQPEAAEFALRHLLGAEPGHTQALSNMVLALRALGRPDEAQATAAQLRRLEKVAPFEFYNLGMAALRAGDAQTAREWLLKELARDPDDHELHFALAQAEWALGHADAAQQALTQAMRLSPQPAMQNLYAAKLARLQALGHGTGPVPH